MNPAQTTDHSRESLRAHPVLGTAALILGSLLLCLGFVVETSGELPFRMPRTWYINRPLWYFFGLSSFMAGCWLLKSPRADPAGWKPSRPGVRFQRVIFHTRSGCHLCESAERLLRQYADYLPPPHQINVETDQDLMTRFGTIVPVVEIDGKLRFRGGINEFLLRRLIEGTAPIETSTENTNPDYT